MTRCVMEWSKVCDFKNSQLVLSAVQRVRTFECFKLCFAAFCSDAGTGMATQSDKMDSGVSAQL